MKSEQFKHLETTITVDRSELEDKGDQNVAYVDVVDGDKVSRFFVSASVNKRGRAVLSVSVNKPDFGSVTKSVTGFKRDRHE